MLACKTIIRLKKLGLNNLAIANGANCKWDSVNRVLSRCEAVWGSVDGVLENLSNEEISSAGTLSLYVDNAARKTGIHFSR